MPQAVLIDKALIFFLLFPQCPNEDHTRLSSLGFYFAHQLRPFLPARFHRALQIVSSPGDDVAAESKKALLFHYLNQQRSARSHPPWSRRS